MLLALAVSLARAAAIDHRDAYLSADVLAHDASALSITGCTIAANVRVDVNITAMAQAALSAGTASSEGVSVRIVDCFFEPNAELVLHGGNTVNAATTPMPVHVAVLAVSSQGRVTVHDVELSGPVAQLVFVNVSVTAPPDASPVTQSPVAEAVPATRWYLATLIIGRVRLMQDARWSVENSSFGVVPGTYAMHQSRVVYGVALLIGNGGITLSRGATLQLRRVNFTAEADSLRPTVAVFGIDSNVSVSHGAQLLCDEVHVFARAGQREAHGIRMTGSTIDVSRGGAVLLRGGSTRSHAVWAQNYAVRIVESHVTVDDGSSVALRGHIFSSGVDGRSPSSADGLVRCIAIERSSITVANASALLMRDVTITVSSVINSAFGIHTDELDLRVLHGSHVCLQDTTISVTAGAVSAHGVWFKSGSITLLNASMLRLSNASVSAAGRPSSVPSNGIILGIPEQGLATAMQLDDGSALVFDHVEVDVSSLTSARGITMYATLSATRDSVVAFRNCSVHVAAAGSLARGISLDGSLRQWSLSHASALLVLGTRVRVLGAKTSTAVVAIVLPRLQLADGSAMLVDQCELHVDASDRQEAIGLRFDAAALRNASQLGIVRTIMVLEGKTAAIPLYAMRGVGDATVTATDGSVIELRDLNVSGTSGGTASHIAALDSVRLDLGSSFTVANVVARPPSDAGGAAGGGFDSIVALYAPGLIATNFSALNIDTVIIAGPARPSRMYAVLGLTPSACTLGADAALTVRNTTFDPARPVSLLRLHPASLEGAATAGGGVTLDSNAGGAWGSGLTMQQTPPHQARAFARARCNTLGQAELATASLLPSELVRNVSCAASDVDEAAWCTTSGAYCTMGATGRAASGRDCTCACDDSTTHAVAASNGWLQASSRCVLQSAPDAVAAAVARLVGHVGSGCGGSDFGWVNGPPVPRTRFATLTATLPLAAHTTRTTSLVDASTPLPPATTTVAPPTGNTPPSTAVSLPPSNTVAPPTDPAASRLHPSSTRSMTRTAARRARVPAASASTTINDDVGLTAAAGGDRPAVPATARTVVAVTTTAAVGAAAAALAPAGATKPSLTGRAVKFASCGADAASSIDAFPTWINVVLIVPLGGDDTAGRARGALLTTLAFVVLVHAGAVLLMWRRAAAAAAGSAGNAPAGGSDGEGASGAPSDSNRHPVKAPSWVVGLVGVVAAYYTPSVAELAVYLLASGSGGGASVVLGIVGIAGTAAVVALLALGATTPTATTTSSVPSSSPPWLRAYVASIAREQCGTALRPLARAALPLDVGAALVVAFVTGLQEAGALASRSACVAGVVLCIAALLALLAYLVIVWPYPWRAEQLALVVTTAAATALWVAVGFAAVDPSLVGRDTVDVLAVVTDVAFVGSAVALAVASKLCPAPRAPGDVCSGPADGSAETDVALAGPLLANVPTMAAAGGPSSPTATLEADAVATHQAGDSHPPANPLVR